MCSKTTLNSIKSNLLDMSIHVVLNMNYWTLISIFTFNPKEFLIKSVSQFRFILIIYK
jgi:hypothetical protein